MMIAGLDTETTGLNPDKGDRIIEVCVVKVDTEGKSHAVFEQRINPRKQISPEASAVHHIYNEDLEDAPFFTMENGRWATGTGKLPSLQELCFTCGINYDPEKAHAARYDVNRMLECLFVGLRKQWYTLKEGA